MSKTSILKQFVSSFVALAMMMGTVTVLSGCGDAEVNSPAETEPDPTLDPNYGTPPGSASQHAGEGGGDAAGEGGDEETETDAK